MNGAKNTLRTITTNLVKRTNSIGPVNTSRSRSSSAVSPPLSRRSSSVNLNSTTSTENSAIKNLPKTPKTDINQVTTALSGGTPILKNGTVTNSNSIKLPSNASAVNLTDQREYSTGLNIIDDNMGMSSGLEQKDRVPIIVGIESGGIEYFPLPSIEKPNIEKKRSEDDFMIGIESGAIDFFQISSFENLEGTNDENENNFYVNTEYNAEGTENNYWVSPSESNVSEDQSPMVVLSVDKTPSTINTSLSETNSEYNPNYMQPNNSPSDTGLALGVIDFIGMPKEI